MRVYIFIPARYHSTRLAGKLLCDLAGKPVLQHTYEQAIKAKCDEVIIATDDQRIKAVAEKFNAKVMMTASSHQSGTERIAECVAKLNLEADDIVVNLQGDEPFLPPILIQQLVKNLVAQWPNHVNMATLCEVMHNQEEIFNPNNVKVIFNEQGLATYFSRAVIPWFRDGFKSVDKTLPKEYCYYRHIGIYAFRANFIKQYAQWPTTPWEKLEALEQLRVLWYGEKIHIEIAKEAPGIGIDTQEDLSKAWQMLQRIK
ncbi:MAG: 3-deoxy-manno-octulosonate cytidylyltransferase [Gammaproteobacteria bacterium RIFCSPHIGHO2_12_FULL_35_23]|nr:MAG: 3-deoxy-manno-octulosonate cytidylyltransferase [Gammaproteobacteria bacterium RIFCSPHIGHO2_12_FULL_35_23]